MPCNGLARNGLPGQHRPGHGSSVGDTTARHCSAGNAAAAAFWQVSAGQEHTCGVTTDYVPYCWGDNWLGQLGDGTAGLFESDVFNHQSIPHLVEGGLNFKQIQAGTSHTCAITPANVVYCWGMGSSGELGIGTTGIRTTPTRI